ncbi:protein of unknown function [Taphrina deformans PYCC 5710]|uniref:Uncharacterized protein n=1 Tax=Taphrina deformans (strain PYCC 5710 / ATCC 11124 / CBS 356.35 / IMI 108563 / JCM 9778 / NBRC 8474) TaxID=1097556 RepID=R4XCU5_TAPDE|nr:protein of unknown function [Taphrina deformans PYCC 5710]|eukprot:CCG83634.1 protein of unknown function [Taphrina deformans PYCC 5710]
MKDILCLSLFDDRTQALELLKDEQSRSVVIMARYSREEILHLRESPIIVFHTPPLPDWISPVAIAAAAQNKSNRTDKQNSSRNPRTIDGTNEESNSLSLSRLSRGDKHEASIGRNGRIATEKSDRNDDRSETHSRRSERDRAERLDSSGRSAREPKKPDDTLENFGSRRARNADGSLTSRTARSKEVDNEFVFRASLKTKTTQPEWLAKEAESVQESDSAAGKTVDDFERWKRSMKKNDGSGDTGLPPLQEDMSVSSTHVTRDQDQPPKDVKPPPGFANVLPQPPVEHTFSTAEFGDLFGGINDDSKSVPNTTSAPLPPGLGTSTSALSTSQTQGSSKPVGTSKFSKFFGQASQGQAQSPQKVKTPELSSRPSNNGPDLFASLTAPKSTGNKDDAEGFERILAMLSSQSAPSQRNPTQSDPMSQKSTVSKAYHDPPQLDFHDQSRTQLPQTAFRGHESESLQHQPPSRIDSSTQLPTGAVFPPQTLGTRPIISPLYERPYSNGPYSPERTSMPVMRDSSNGASTIMSNHTQNQDFFSSLLSSRSYDRSYTDSYGPLSDAFGSGPKQESAPLMQQHTPDQSSGYRHPFDYRDAHLMRGSHGSGDQHQQRSRQQPNQSQVPHNQTAQRPRDELEFLNQLMAEQRMNSNQYPGPSQNPHQQIQRLEHSQPQGFVTGIGSRPGPGWNGQFEIDPRIPNASQYRP